MTNHAAVTLLERSEHVIGSHGDRVVVMLTTWTAENERKLRSCETDVTTDVSAHDVAAERAGCDRAALVRRHTESRHPVPTERTASACVSQKNKKKRILGQTVAARTVWQREASKHHEMVGGKHTTFAHAS